MNKDPDARICRNCALWERWRGHRRDGFCYALDLFTTTWDKDRCVAGSFIKK